MGNLLTDVPGWLIALALAGLMVVAWSIGWRSGKRMTAEQRAIPASKFNEAIMALLGLLLAFTFSMSVGKHDQRRQMVVTDSNAIGDFYTCASLVKEPIRGQLQAAIRDYAEHRLDLGKTPMNDATFRQKLDECVVKQNRMQALVEEAVNAQTPVVVPLVNTLNEVTSSHAARLAATRDRLPWSIVLLLFLTALVSTVLVGRQQGASGEWHPRGTAGYILLVTLTVGVILDLNQPRRGLITVSQEPMQRVLGGMGQ
jgi:hypothetical protein